MSAAQVNRNMPESPDLGRLRAAGLIAVLLGALGSIGLMLWVGRHNEHELVMILMGIWVFSPFAALVLAHLLSKRWASRTRATLYVMMLVLAPCSLALYAAVAFGPPRPKPAFTFVLLPPVSWLVTAIALSIAAFASGRLSQHRRA